jgi:hypothetical protein
MPVTKQCSVAYKLMAIAVSMSSGYITCSFNRTIDDVPTGALDMLIEGPDMVTLLSTQATAGQPLGSELTDAVYAYAIGKGVIDGVIS